MVPVVNYSYRRRNYEEYLCWILGVTHDVRTSGTHLPTLMRTHPNREIVQDLHSKEETSYYYSDKANKKKKKKKKDSSYGPDAMDHRVDDASYNGHGI